MGARRTRFGIGVTVAAAVMATAIPVSGASSASSAAPPLRVREWHPALAQSTRARLAAGVPSVPMWSHTYKVGGTKYKISMVGKDPFTRQAKPATTVPTQIIPIKLTFTDTGDVYDPTAPDPTCLGGASALTRTLESPIFTSKPYTLGATSIGKGQFVDAFQRANFWKQTKPTGINPGYHVNLAVSVLPTMSFSVTGAEVAAPCGKLGKIDVGAFDALLVTHLADFAAAGVDSTKFPLLLISNVVMYQGDVTQCCILGFHAAIDNPYDGGVQTLGVAEYDSTRQFNGIRDVAIVTHEVGEWMDDPTGANVAPSWGHTGQVAGCQGALEVGDPLTGTSMTVKSSGTVYHPQEMAFASWFYGLQPSGSVNGWYSMNGAFKQPAVPCV
ncbi:MAG TPA: hypothetical protein VIK61_06820 [Acidimicrobiia bacterium]